MLQVTRGPTVAPIRLMLYGQEGVGKTTWAAGCPSCLFLSVEDGGGDLDYQRVTLDSWPDLRAAVRDMARDAMGYRTIAIDTIDSFERKLHAWLCSEADKRSIEEIGGGYGKGYTAAVEEMAGLAHELDELRAAQKVNVILLGHAQVKAFNDPLGNPFDRYELRMHRAASALWTGWVDALLFACFDVTVKTVQRKKGAVDPNDKGKAVSAQRVVYTSKDAAYDAKNRYGLPEEIPLGWPAFAKAIRWDERDAALAFPMERFVEELALLGMAVEVVEELCRTKGTPLPATLSGDRRRKLLDGLKTDAGRAAYAAAKPADTTQDASA